MIITSSRYALVGYFITSYPTRSHGIIVIRALTLVSHDFFENGFCATTQPLIKHACYLCLGLFLSPQNIKKYFKSELLPLVQIREERVADH